MITHSRRADKAGSCIAFNRGHAFIGAKVVILYNNKDHHLEPYLEDFCNYEETYTWLRPVT